MPNNTINQSAGGFFATTAGKVTIIISSVILIGAIIIGGAIMIKDDDSSNTGDEKTSQKSTTSTPTKPAVTTNSTQTPTSVPTSATANTAAPTQAINTSSPTSAPTVTSAPTAIPAPSISMIDYNDPTLMITLKYPEGVTLSTETLSLTDYVNGGTKPLNKLIFTDGNGNTLTILPHVDGPMVVPVSRQNPNNPIVLSNGNAVYRVFNSGNEPGSESVTYGNEVYYVGEGHTGIATNPKLPVDLNVPYTRLLVSTLVNNSDYSTFDQIVGSIEAY